MTEFWLSFDFRGLVKIDYFKERNSSGFVEGFNNRIKVLTRRCYGLGNAKRLFQRIKLDTEGLNLFKFSGAYC